MSSGLDPFDSYQRIQEMQRQIDDLLLLLTGSGYVVGPPGVTDSAVVLYDGATGRLVKNSVVTITGTGHISGAVLDGGLFQNFFLKGG